MKKLILSAVMMMAFVGTSFGKTEGVTIMDKDIMQPDSCETAAAQEVDRREAAMVCKTGDCFSSSYRSYLYAQLVQKCYSTE